MALESERNKFCLITINASEGGFRCVNEDKAKETLTVNTQTHAVWFSAVDWQSRFFNILYMK